ncbi:outer membrane beta-barrel protein [Pontibacter lucknowensis]|uniref:Outer membrane protein beta-barrel domain-containing protein n=1 Tax=Pontibacter lucknowensis TaxID=1077936 RepID=A0A1N6WW13_9BACT|nr:outer membrane beta-barrel protein [Pontibacter lucknowensis]SIQ94253.1 Outer membrane protein beta-barrel domain-containing protein [Pontibacter lucknowensis]
MKKILLLVTAIIMAAATGVSAKGGQTIGERLGQQDTIVVKMANGAKMVLYLQNIEQLKAFENYSLDSLMRVLNKYVDQVDRMDGANKELKSQETTVVFGKDDNDPETVTITVQETGQDGKVNREKHEIRINKNIKIDVEIEEKDGNTKVDVNMPNRAERDSIRTSNVKKSYKATRFNFDLDLGLNNFLNSNSQQVPDLKPLGSRYVSINWHLNSQIGGRKSPLYLVSGLEFAFNNYMFDRNFVIEEDVNDVTFFRREMEINYDKVKLTHSSVNVPLMPMLKFKRQNGKEGFKLGAGPFVGYRLGAHSKFKFEDSGRTQKEKVRSSYNLSDFQYGLTGVIGYGNLDLFVKYNMNDLFKDNRGPDANVISFGLRLFN